MQEIAKQFKEEYIQLLSRYKNQLSNSILISNIQSVTRQELIWVNRPEKQEQLKRIIADFESRKFPDLEGVWKSIDDIKNDQIGKAIVKTLTSDIRRQCDETNRNGR